MVKYLANEKGNGLAFNAILRFMQFLLEKANRKKITGSTVEEKNKSFIDKTKTE